MIIVKFDNDILAFCKSFGVKDITKLVRKETIDKNGHRRIVYVKNNREKVLKYSNNKEFIEDSVQGKFKNGIKSVIKSFSIYRKNNENSFYILYNGYKVFPKGFKIKYVNTENDCEFNPTHKTASIINCSKTDKYLLGIAYHELFHAIDYYFDNTKYFTRYFEDIITENPITEIPEELRNINIEYQNELLKATDNINPYLEKLNEITKEEFYKLPEVKEGLKDFLKLKKRIQKNGLDLLTNLFDALNINSDEVDIILCSPHSKGYFSDNTIRIKEVMADYCAISLLFPKLKEKINIYKPGLADNLDRVLRLMKEEMEKKWKQK